MVLFLKLSLLECIRTYLREVMTITSILRYEAILVAQTPLLLVPLVNIGQGCKSAFFEFEASLHIQVIFNISQHK